MTELHNGRAKKRVSRGSVKKPLSIPYTASSPFLVRPTSGENLHGRRKATGLLSRFASTVAQKILHIPRPQLQYGDVIRDVPFHVQDRTVAFFSTHPSLCGDVFGVCHGQCVRFTRGPWSNRAAIAVGARGDCLWVVSDDGPVTARPVYAMEQHGWEKLTPEPALLLRFREGLEAARRDADLDYDPEQRDFLQKAPDLFAEVVDDCDDQFGDNFAADDALTNRKSGTGSVSLSDVGGESAISDFVMTSSHVRKRVILLPQVVQVTGDLGWAGEGVVVVDGGGVESFTASLSASLLL